MSAKTPAAAAIDRNQQTPLYEQVREHLRAICLANGPNTPLPSVRDLCEKLGVNHNTLTRALRDLEADGLVQVLPRKGTFVRELPQAGIELMIMVRNVRGSDANLSTIDTLLTGMQQTGGGNGTVMEAWFDSPFPDVEKYLDILRLRRVSALAATSYDYRDFPEAWDEAHFLYSLSRHMPLVLVGKPHRWLELDTVYCDPRPQIRQWLEQCHKMGVRQFGYINTISTISTARHYQERMEEFRQFLLEHGLVWHAEHILSLSHQNLHSGRNVPASGGGRERDMIVGLLDQEPRVQAVVCLSTSSAYTLIIEAHRRGLEPGKDIHLLCIGTDFHDAEPIAPYVSIVNLQTEDLGRVTMELIQERVRGKGEPAPFVQRIPAQLMAPGEW